MQPTADLSILTLVANASLVVKCVLAILVFLSLASWTVIFQKYFTISRAARQVEEFEARFWSGTELNQLLETAKRNHDTAGIEERIFSAGMTEYLKQSRQDPNALNSVSRAMRAVYNREMDHLERSLPLLASIGSTSPYIGLFGTVWGIMNAFTGLSTLDNVSLAVVAPGIAEALVATAIGLFAAIPAVAAYNYYNNRVGRLTVRLEGFSEEFLNILQRQHARSQAMSLRGNTKRRGMMAEMNVVPYIDVMLVLVVILMVAAPFVNPSVVNLPSVNKASKAPEQVIEVIVYPDSRLSIRQGKDMKPIDIPGLVAAVKTAQGEKSNIPVVIAADKDVRYEDVVNVLKLLQSADVLRVGLALRIERSAEAR